MLKRMTAVNRYTHVLLVRDIHSIKSRLLIKIATPLLTNDLVGLAVAKIKIGHFYPDWRIATFITGQEESPTIKPIKNNWFADWCEIFVIGTIVVGLPLLVWYIFVY